MKDKATFQNKVKVLNKLFDSGCDTEKKLQQLDMEAILKIPNITIPDIGVITIEILPFCSSFCGLREYSGKRDCTLCLALRMVSKQGSPYAR